MRVVCHTQEIFGEEKLANLVNHELAICQNFSLIFTDTPKMYMEYALTVAYLPNSFSPIAFTCMVCQNFSLAKYFPCTVHNYRKMIRK